MKVIQSVNFVTLMYSILKKKNASCGLAPENTDFLNLCFDTMF